MAEGSLFRAGLSHGFREGSAEGGEAVGGGDPDLEPGGLTLEVPRHEALARQFHAMHPGLDATSAMITVHRCQMVRPKRCDARRASLRAIAPGVSAFQNLAFLRSGMIAATPRAAMVSWHLRASKAPSAVTLPIC